MAGDNRIRILIADDHTMVAEAVKALLMQEFNVVGVVADGRALVEAALDLKPDLALVDIALPKLNGLDAAQRIKNAVPGVTVIFLTMLNDPDVTAEAFRRGASAVISKTSPYSELVLAIRQVLNQRLQIVPPARPHVRDDIVEAVATLTERQRDVLQLLAEGFSMKEIAGVLNLAIRTVAFHKYRVMQALGVRRDADLVQCAIRGRLLFIEAPVETHVSAHESTIEQRRPHSLWRTTKAA